MYTTNVFHSYRKQITVLKWSSQIIAQIWKLIYFQWIHCSIFKHAVESLDDNTNELIINTEIID